MDVNRRISQPWSSDNLTSATGIQHLQLCLTRSYANRASSVIRHGKAAALQFPSAITTAASADRAAMAQHVNFPIELFYSNSTDSLHYHANISRVFQLSLTANSANDDRR